MAVETFRNDLKFSGIRIWLRPPRQQQQQQHTSCQNEILCIEHLIVPFHLPKKTPSKTLLLQLILLKAGKICMYVEIVIYIHHTHNCTHASNNAGFHWMTRAHSPKLVLEIQIFKRNISRAFYFSIIHTHTHRYTHVQHIQHIEITQSTYTHVHV